MNLTKASIWKYDELMPWAWVFVGIVAFTPVLYNGFPWVFSDSWNYISRWDSLSSAFPPFYSLVTWSVGKLSSLYMVPVIQICAALYVIHAFVQAFGGCQLPVIPVLVAFGTTVLTQLPWLASWLMPDVYAGLGAAALIVLLLDEREFSGRKWLDLFLISWFSAVVSTANLVALAGLGCACLIIRPLFGYSNRSRHYRIVISMIVLTILATLSANRTLYGRTVLSDAGPALFFAKMADAGIAQDYLHEACPERSQPICAYLDELDQIDEVQGFLWSNTPRTLAVRTDAWLDQSGEFKDLNRRIVLYRFPEVLGLMAGDIFRLFTMTSLDATGQGTGELVRPQDDTVETAIERYYPQSVRDYRSARQQLGGMQKFPAAFYEVSTYVSYVLLLALLIYSLISSNRQLGVICLAVIIAIALFLVVQGGLVGAYARYHVKISWLAWLCVLTAMARLVLDHRVSAGRRAANEDRGMTSGSEAVR